MNGKDIVHAYFSGLGWPPQKGDEEQYMNVNLRADWLGDKIDQHVRALALKIVNLEDKVAELELKLAQASEMPPSQQVDFVSDPLFHVEPPV